MDFKVYIQFVIKILLNLRDDLPNTTNNIQMAKTIVCDT